MEDNINVNILTSKPDMAEMPVETSHWEKLVFRNGCCFKDK